MRKGIIILILSMILFAMGCSKVDEDELGYEIYEELYPLAEDYDFNCIQVKGMDDLELQDKINRRLKMPLIYFENKGEITEYRYTAYEPIIHLQSSRYLSVENTFQLIRNGCVMETISKYATVDMETGELMYLDDFIRLDEDFAKAVQSGKILKRDAYLSWTSKEMTDIINSRFVEMEVHDIEIYYIGFLKGRLLWYLDTGDSGGAEFYLEEGYIAYNYNDGLVDTKIKASDVRELLKVEEW